MSLLLIPSIGFAFSRSLDQKMVKAKDKKDYVGIIEILVDNKMYFTAVPFIKEYMVERRRGGKKIDRLIEKVITNIGVRQFEILSVDILKNYDTPIIHYILAKKYFRLKKYKKSLSHVENKIPRGHPARPFALLLQGTLYSLMKNPQWAINAFTECVGESRRQERRYRIKTRKRQLRINKDTCTAGIARTQFWQKKYEQANLTYLDIEKESVIWPEILFEEAWNSFYLKNYNRTLGKLVTYKSPVLNYVFNPEVEILRALSYLELCLYSDAKKTVDEYYKKYEKSSLRMANFLKRQGRDYRKFYFLAKDRGKGELSGNSLLDQLLKAAIEDPAYKELYGSFQRSKLELVKIKSIEDARLRRVLKSGLKETIVVQRDLIGAYIRKRLLLFVGQINKSFRGMSYISLEIIKLRKDKLLGIQGENRSRGDINNLVRTEKQYFWTFNGEFWADELGDYVFSLESKCKQS